MPGIADRVTMRRETLSSNAGRWDSSVPRFFRHRAAELGAGWLASQRGDEISDTRITSPPVRVRQTPRRKSPSSAVFVGLSSTHRRLLGETQHSGVSQERSPSRPPRNSRARRKPRLTNAGADWSSATSHPTWRAGVFWSGACRSTRRLLNQCIRARLRSASWPIRAAAPRP